MEAMRALYRLVLLVSPEPIRRSHGAEMEDIFMWCVDARSAGRAWPILAVACLRGLADAFWFGIASRRAHQAIDANGNQGSESQRIMMRKQDFVSALRFMRKQPFFAGAIVLMLALGIGATTALFSVVYGVLLKPLPFPSADRIVQVWGSRPDRGWDQVSLTEANFWDLLDMNKAFEAFGGWHDASAILTDGAEAEQVNAARVTSGFFRALGVQPVAGRLFIADDDVTGEVTKPVLLSHGLWIRRYGGDPGIVGRPIILGSGPRTVIGVLPAGTPWLDQAELFLPMVRRADADRGSFEYTAVGRLKPGVSLDAARADLQAVSKNLERLYPATNTGLGAAIGSSRDWIANDDLRRTLWILLGSVGLLLLIACVNVTNLLLSRAATRARESAVRAALGATRADLVREWLMESVILSIVATGLGLGLAEGLLRVMQAVSPGDLPRLGEVAINGWVFGVACALAVCVGVGTGLVPALQTPMNDIVPVLRHGQRGMAGDLHQTRLRNLFVGAEVALSLLLLIGAGLLVRSLSQVMTVDRGFASDHRLFARVSIPASYGPVRSSQLVTEILDRVGALRDVTSVAASSGRPLSRGSTGLGFVAGDQANAVGAVPWATWRIVTKNYFQTIGVPMIAGRGFADDEEMGKPWRTIVSKRVADLLWPGQDPIGRTIVLWKGQGDNRAEVIGVVGNMRERGLESDPTLAVYLPAGRGSATSLQLVMHTLGRPEDTVPALRSAIAGVDRRLPVSNVRSFDDVVAASVATRRFTMLLLAGFAGLALVLALAGVYGVLVYSVARRTNEIGIRLALGAAHGSVLRLVVAQGLRPVFVGLAVGLGASIWLSRLMTSLLFGVTASDPLTYGVASAAVMLTAMLACYLPARMVLHVNPVVALRND
jgi:predicted permease